MPGDEERVLAQAIIERFMNKITQIAGVPLEQYGDTMKISGVILDDGHTAVRLYLPGKGFDFLEELPYAMDLNEAVAWLKQSDLPTAPVYSRHAEILAGTEMERVVKATYEKARREVSRSIAWEVYRRDGFVCRYCGAEGVLTYDHVIPVALDGETTVENGASACRSCNSKKGHKSPREWYHYMFANPDRYPRDRVMGFHYAHLE